MNLNDDLTLHFRISKYQTPALRHLGIHTIKDLLYHFPIRYNAYSGQKTIADLILGEQVTIRGRVLEAKAEKTWKKKINIARALITDGTGSIRLTWFNQPYVARMLSGEKDYLFSGKVGQDKKGLYIANPRFEPAQETIQRQSAYEGKLIPVYPETRGITSRWFSFAVARAMEHIQKEEIAAADPLPKEMLRKYHLPSLHPALSAIHAPEKLVHTEAARKRFAFEEIFYIQLQRNKERFIREKKPAYPLHSLDAHIKEFIESLPFTLTAAQTRAINVIAGDVKKPSPMARLLEGDVGSGKTVVAASLLYAIAQERLQGAFMAPTEVVARQHYAELIERLKDSRIPIGLITSSECRKFPSKVHSGTDTHISKNQLLKWIASGEIRIVVGTHALIQDKVLFKNLAFVVIDEQHRFGIRQRAKLVGRGLTPTDTRTNADNLQQSQADNNLLYEDLSYKIRGIIFTVKRNLGLGHKESIYHKALAEEFKKNGLQFESERIIDIFYGKKKIGIYKPDFLIENKLLIELKALPFIGMQQKKQIWTYLKGSPYKLALLVNFGNKDVEIKRIVYDSARIEGQRQSASSPRESAKQIPHLLTMTATPIPRTLALTVYGDLDLALLDEMPPGRKQVITFVVAPEKREEAYEKMRLEIHRGRQAYVVCPRIEETQTDADWTRTNAELNQKSWLLEMKSVKAEYKKLKEKIFPEFSIGMLHGRMLPKEKEKIMSDFRSEKLNILVATSVIEVGVNVPNATIIMIEGADRFGLAQLHQLRGRVLRSTYQPYCFIFNESRSEKTKERLQALIKAKNGFELAEYDLQFRGPGELTGANQWGISDVAMEALKNIKMVEAARTEAQQLLTSDFELKKYPLLAEQLKKLGQEGMHFE